MLTELASAQQQHVGKNNMNIPQNAQSALTFLDVCFNNTALATTNGLVSRLFRHCSVL